MSVANPQPLETVLVLDPMCDFEAKSVYAVEKSVSTSNYYNITSNNSSSVSTTWVINVNDNTTITDRLFLMDMLWDVEIDADGQGKLPDGAKFALRSFPMMKACSNINLTLGNSVSTVQIGDIANCMERYGLMNRYLNYSSTPVQPDMSGSYADQNGGNLDPFAFYATTQSDYHNPRGSFPIISVAQAANKLTVRYRIIEPIFISPLLQSLGMDGRKEGLTKLSQIQLTVNWQSNIFARMFSSVGDGAYAGITGKVMPVTNGSNLRVVQYVPSVLDIGRNLDTQCLAYNEVVNFSTDYQAMTSFDPARHPINTPVATFNSAVIQLAKIPKEVFFFVRPDNSVYINGVNGKSPTLIPDVFARYDTQSLRVVFNGTNQLNQISDVNLYRICRQNGCNLSWQQWAGGALNNATFNAAPAVLGYSAGVGSPICLKFGRDIMLPPDLAPGCNTKCNFQISAGFSSVLPSTVFGANVPHMAYVIVVYEGCLEIYGSGGTCTQTLGCLTTEDVLTAVKRNYRVHYEVIHDDLYGGANIFSRAFNWLREGKYRPYVEKVRNFIEHPVTQEIAKAASHHLRSRGHNSIANAVSSATQKGLLDSALQKLEGLHGNGLVGGKKLSKAQLKKMLL